MRPTKDHLLWNCWYLLGYSMIKTHVSGIISWHVLTPATVIKTWTWIPISNTQIEFTEEMECFQWCLRTRRILFHWALIHLRWLHKLIHMTCAFTCMFTMFTFTTVKLTVTLAPGIELPTYTMRQPASKCLQGGAP